METMIFCLLVVNLVLLVVLLVKQFTGKQDDTSRELQELRNEVRTTGDTNAVRVQQSMAANVSSVNQNVTSGINSLGQSLNTNITNMNASVSGSIGTMKTAISEGQTAAAQLQQQKLTEIEKVLTAKQQDMNRNMDTRMQAMEIRLQALEKSNEDKLEAMRTSMRTSMGEMQNTLQSGMQTMREENNQRLNEIRATVDEKLQDTLQKRITESFKSVSEQLEQVYKGLGEMQHLATDVGGLKQVLSGVKTRGILGEIQLGAILEEILSPEQYAVNCETIPHTGNRVEYAVRMPGEDGTPVFMPIDSKFPGDTYMHLQDAIVSGDTTQIAEERKKLEIVLKKCAKDIHDKYVEPPYTTNFGILFIPFEGLYAEVVNMGMIEQLQRDYNINIAGPSTMAALLNALQMGFRTLAIQKRSNEVWQVLGAVKTEFGKFEEVMVKMQNHLRQTSSDLDTLMGTRCRAITRRLKDVQELDEESTRQYLGTGSTASAENEA